MDVMWTIVVVAALCYLASLALPYVACRACKKTPGRHHGAIFTFAHRKCRRCRGAGRELRLGARLVRGIFLDGSK